jgi:hypothetical protein
MAVTPKSSWPWVHTLLYSIFDQPEVESVLSQYDRVVYALFDKLPKVAEYLDSARDELLAFTAFPKQIWRQIRARTLTPRPWAWPIYCFLDSSRRWSAPVWLLLVVYLRASIVLRYADQATG